MVQVRDERPAGRTRGGSGAQGVTGGLGGAGHAARETARLERDVDLGEEEELRHVEDGQARDGREEERQEEDGGSGDGGGAEAGAGGGGSGGAWMQVDLEDDEDFTDSAA